MGRLPKLATVLAFAAFLAVAAPHRAEAGSQCLVVNQVYVPGGTGSSVYDRSFVELLNRCASSTSLAGVYLHTLSSDNSTGSATPLSGSVSGGRFYLVTYGSAGSGSPLPTPDATSASVALPTPGKVFLSTSATVGSSCPSGAGLLDLVGYGTSSTPCVEGSAAPAPSAVDSVRRTSCADTDSNSTDFVLTDSSFGGDGPSPRNSTLASPLCGGSQSPCLLVNEVYAPGGTGSSVYDRSFVELLNRCDTMTSLDFVHLDVVNAAQTDYEGALLSGPLGRGHYYLVSFGATGAGSPVPAPDFLNPFGITNAGSAFLVSDPALDSVNCPTGPAVIDLVGFGSSTRPCYEGPGPAPLPNATKSISRSACLDTNSNSGDFSSVDPSPRNSASSPGCGVPSAVMLAGFSAARSSAGILVRWRTASEAGVLGFNVYRKSAGRRVRVNRNLVSSRHGSRGSGYAYRDRRPPRGGAARYWLEAVSMTGESTWYGPVAAGSTSSRASSNR